VNSLTVGSNRAIVGAFFGLFGHQRFKNCSD